jgi:capsular polysaccharide transport system permease protein
MIDKSAPSFMHQLRIQGRVIWALILREMITRYGREGIGVLWFIAEPAMFIVGVMIIFSQFHSANAGLSVAEYLAVSYPTILLWRNGTNRIQKSLEINRALLHHKPIRPIDIIYSRIILEFSTAAAAFIVLFIIFVAVGICQMPADILTMVLGYLLVVWFSFAFVMIMAALSELSEAVDRISHIILYLMLPFSGVFVAAYMVPQQLRDYLLLFPLVNAVEYFHHGYYGSRMMTYYHLQYTVVVILAMTFIGLVLTQVAIKRVQAS